MAKNYLFTPTDDGSFTLRLDEGESMHSLRGAVSETLYIYGEAALQVERLEAPLRVASLGLGLGYNEIMMAAAYPDLQNLESFEIDSTLGERILEWINSPMNFAQEHNEFAKAYDDAAFRFGEKFGVTPDLIRQRLKGWSSSGKWRLRQELTPETEISEPYTCIFYDAFSSKTSPELWSEIFLNRFLLRASAPTCALSTYACTGTMKRALKNQGFDVEIRPGFANKRESILAIKKPLV